MQFQEFNGILYHKRTDKKGYWYCSHGNIRQGYEPRMHRAVWIYHNGPIPEGYIIHHKDENKDNNTISNLECVLNETHSSLHAKQEYEKKPLLKFQCIICDTIFLNRMPTNKMTPLYCTQACRDKGSRRRRMLKNLELSPEDMAEIIKHSITSL